MNKKVPVRSHTACGKMTVRSGLGIEVCIAIARGVMLLLGLASCDVYDPSLLPPEFLEAGGRQDGNSDAEQRDRVTPPTGTGGGDAAGRGGSTVADVGSGGAGGADAGSAGAGGKDASSGGADGSGVGDADARADNGGTGGLPIDGASDGDAEGNRDGQADGPPDCLAVPGDPRCRDSAADVADGIVDQCPTDPTKTEPGICGCGTPDTDSDSDGAADCIDGCPTDARKKQPGICGCNADDPPDLDAGEAFCLKALLAHRYSFNGTGTMATDSIGTAHGTIMGGSNASMSGGSVSLSGDLGARYTSEGFVSLPANLLGGLTDATFEAWITWRGAGTSGNRAWQRFFDFGDQIASGSELIGNTYLFLTPQHATNSGLLRAAFSTAGSAMETVVNATRAFPLNAQAHVAVVMDDVNGAMTLYLDGSPEGTVAWTGALGSINDANSWLGRSNYGVDPELNGIVHEFRIYRAALSAAQVRVSYLAGPDPSFF